MVTQKQGVTRQELKCPRQRAQLVQRPWSRRSPSCWLEQGRGGEREERRQEGTGIAQGFVGRREDWDVDPKGGGSYGGLGAEEGGT